MIGRLTGTIDAVFFDSIIINTGSIGYVVFLPAKILSKCISGEKISFFICSQTREDGTYLYGIETVFDMEVMKELVKVNGISYRIAGNIIAEVTSEFVVEFIATGNCNGLKVSGVGNKLAERIVNELQEKMTLLHRCNIPTTVKKDSNDNKIDTKSNTDTSNTNKIQEAVMALISLGYSKSASAHAVKTACSEKNKDIKEISTGELVTKALPHL